MLANKTAEWSKAMRNEDVSKLLLRRFAAAQHPAGRLLLNLHVLLQRVRSQWRAHGTDIIKRTSDILVSVFFLVLLSPLFLLIALMVQIEDGGPAFFVAEMDVLQPIEIIPAHDLHILRQEWRQT